MWEYVPGAFWEEWRTDWTWQEDKQEKALMLGNDYDRKGKNISAATVKKIR
jgi:hypothetical protein